MAVVYPDREVLDCALSVVQPNRRQHCFFGSRRAPTERTEMTVGPFRIEVLKPMRRTRVVLTDNESGISCDLTFSARTTGPIRRNRSDRPDRAGTDNLSEATSEFPDEGTRLFPSSMGPAHVEGRTRDRQRVLRSGGAGSARDSELARATGRSRNRLGAERRRRSRTGVHRPPRAIGIHWFSSMARDRQSTDVLNTSGSEEVVGQIYTITQRLGQRREGAAAEGVQYRLTSPTHFVGQVLTVKPERPMPIV